MGDGARHLGGGYTPAAHSDLTHGAWSSGLGPEPELPPQPDSPADEAPAPPNDSPARLSPTWLGPEDRPLFGCWYVPAGAQARAGVVLVGASGIGADASARAMHEVGLRLRDAGCLVLRYDPPGSGDSADPPEDGLFRRSSGDAHAAALTVAVEAVRAAGATTVAVVGMLDAATMLARSTEPLDVRVLWDPADLAAIRPGRGRVASGPTLVLLREGVSAPSKVSAAFDADTTQWGVARGQDRLLDPSTGSVVLPEPTIGVVTWWLDRELDDATTPVHPVVRATRTTLSPDAPPVVDALVTVGGLPAVRTSITGEASGPAVVLAGSAWWGRAGPRRAWIPLAHRLAAAGRPVVRVALPDQRAVLFDGAAALLDVVRALDLDDVVVCADDVTAPVTRDDLRIVNTLVAPRRVVFEPVAADPSLWNDPSARAAGIDTLTTLLLAHTSPVVDLDALHETDDPAFTEAREALVVAPPPPGRSRLITVTVAVVMGLLVQAVGFALGRRGSAGAAEVLFFGGLLAIFTPCAWRLLGTAADRRERLVTSGLLGVSLVVSLHLLSPSIFTGYDEMLHEGTLWRLGTEHTLFVQNALLPVSSRYPGLELFTLAVHWCTGLPLVAAQFGVLFVSRLVLVLIIFLFTERLTGSTRAGSVSVVVYAVCPQFYAFDAAYAYQTLALALGGGALYLVVRAVDAQRRQRSRALALAIVCLAGVVVTHHLVGWITVGALVIWWVAAAVLRRSADVRTVGVAASAGLVLAVGWTAVNAKALYFYLAPILESAFSGILGLLGTRTTDKRALFKADNGIPTPPWQKLLLLGSTVIVLALLALGILAVFRNRARTGRPLLRGGVMRFLVVVVAASYLVVLGSRLSGPAAQLGGRASTFVFFGIAPVVAAWFVARSPAINSRLATAVAAVTFIGGVLFGAASWTYLPGPYLPAADERSIDAPALDAARWVAAHVPIGSAIADDHDNGALMGDIGHVDPVTEGVPGGINVGPLYFDPSWGSYDTSIVRRAGIRYLVVDTRLAQAPPAFGVYFEAGETQGPERLTLAQLTKFDRVPGIHAVYSHGPITIYDLRGILGTTPPHISASDATSSTAAIAALNHANWVLLVLSAGTAGLWTVRLRRRGPTADRVLDGLLAATGAAIALGVVIVYLPVPSWVAGATVLLTVAAGAAPGAMPRFTGVLPRDHAIRLAESLRRRTTGATT